MGVLIPGLVSVTFRGLPPVEIAQMAAQASLRAIEWGGDIHVPHGNLERAREVRQITQDEGLQVAAYGSYYRVWPIEPVPFERVLDTALALGAPVIRVWAGRVGSSDDDPEHHHRLVQEARRCASMAGSQGVDLVFEYHSGTLTDSRQSALRLLKEIDHPHMGSYWQPPIGQSTAERRLGLNEMLPWLRGLHIFQWQPHKDTIVRLPLQDGEAEWVDYLKAARAASNDLNVLLEFVRDDAPEAFAEDAQTLLQFINKVD